MQNIFLILSSVIFNVFAQLLIKKGMSIFGTFLVTWQNIYKLIIAIFTNLYLFLGAISFGLSALLWMVVLSKINVSVAYPFTSLGFVLTAVFAYLLFNEPFTLQKIIGIIIICIGVIVLTCSKDF